MTLTKPVDCRAAVIRDPLGVFEHRQVAEESIIAIAKSLQRRGHTFSVCIKPERCRVHDLRHSFASRALALDESLPMIGKLLGHSQVETTAQYANLARYSVLESAERNTNSLAADMFRSETVRELR